MIPTEHLDIFHRLAFVNHDFPEVISVGNKCYENFPSHEVAFMNAVANASSGDCKTSIEWLKCSRRHGIKNLRERLRQHEFDPVRDDPLFVAFEQKEWKDLTI